MNSPHLPFALLLIATLLFTSSILLVESTTTTAAVTTTATASAASPAPSPTFALGLFGCNNKCQKRCGNAGYKERCLKYCGICCGKCEGCVPSSPYADKAECPCYRDLKNSKGKDKCP